MTILTKAIKFQIYIFSLFFLLTLNIVLRFVFTSNLFNYISLGVFLVLIAILLMIYKKSEERQVVVPTSYTNVIKYNLYIFVIAYAIASFTLTEELLSLQNIIYFIILFASSIFGIIYNTLILFKVE